MAEPTSTCLCICFFLCFCFRFFLFLCICFFRCICFCFFLFLCICFFRYICFRFFLCFFRNTSASSDASASASSSSSSASASSSSSSASTLNAPYDVFINHRGPDVKKTLARLLYRDLKYKGLQVFLDQPELRSGHIILSQIKAAIQGASVHIAIFSKKYAESKWCLDELVLMLETTPRATILPVFYKVKPSDLRRTDTGAYANALQKHKQRYDFETIKKWKKALSDVADISGFELEACNGGDVVELVDKVIQRVVKEVPKPPLFVAKHKIGLQEKLEDFERTVLSQLEGQGRREAKVVGIVGSGGIGKSTLAREFFNSKRSNYNLSSFIFDVRENTATKSLIHLQRELIKDIKGMDVQIKSSQEGIGILKILDDVDRHALIILDDVDHHDQLDALLPIKDSLDPMSLILITSRDKQVLRIAGITDSSIYQLKGLDRPHSLELFCSHAFFQPHPTPEFKDLVDGFLKACDGLPLSLEVFGALLCQQNDRSYWEEQLNGLEKLPSDIQVRLKISYDSLDPEEQQMFLDIACFSIGEEKDKWIRIWSGSGWKGSVGLRNLENKCLVEVVEVVEVLPWGYAYHYTKKINAIRMHDHLRDLGRSIAKEGSMPRRLWNATINDVYDMLEQSSSVTEVRGIKMASQSTMSDTWEGSFSDEVFRISKLQLLEAEGDLVEGILSKVRSRNLNLIWLRWKKCPGSSLPSCIPMRDLRVLEVAGKDLERLWAPESQAPLLLRELNIVNAPLLEELPNSIDNLMSLQKINLGNFESLKVLPNAFGTLTNLREINLQGCRSLEALPNSINILMSLQKINLGNCESLKVLPNAFGTLTNLREINLQGCRSLEALPNSIDNLMSLQKINLGNCESLKVLPNAFGTLTNLRVINLQGCRSLEALPNSIDILTSLQKINLGNCESLKVLPNAFGTLTNLQEINLQGCRSLEALPNSTDNLTNLQGIHLGFCESLKVLPNAFVNLLHLTHLHLSCCSSLTISNETFGNITTLECLDLSGCLQMEALPLQVVRNRFLKELNLLNTNIKELPSAPTVCPSNLELLILGSPLLKVLPPWLGCLTFLKKLLLHGCLKLKCLPDSIGQLSQMIDLEISKCGMQYLPPAVMQLNNLRILRVRGCPLLELPFKRVEGEGEPSLLTESSQGRELDCSIHTGMIQLEEIHLYLTEISDVSFPQGVCPNLQTLKITWCNNLVEVAALPTTLLRLNLRGCGALRKIGGLSGLANLEKLDIRGCCALEVEELPGVETLISLRSLKTPLETYYPNEEEEEEQMMEDLQKGVIRICGRVFSEEEEED